MTRILADENMTGLGETFARHGKLRTFSGRSLRASDLGDAEILLVRSVTQVNEALLRGSAIRFVGTATIGTDHLDTLWLESQGITWASAPGCNADAAAQYTLGMIALACKRLRADLSQQQVAIVGCGNVGSRLFALLNALSVEVSLCDPPLQESAGLPDGIPGVELSTALQADIVSLHVPLNTSGPHATHHMINEETLSTMKAGSLLVNAARGDVVDGPAMLDAITNRGVHAALDVWPGEPRLDPELLTGSTVATPHVAGYSVEGKRRGTQMIYEAFTDWSGESGDTHVKPGQQTDNVPALFESPVNSWSDVVLAATGVIKDDERMRSTLPDNAKKFDPLRRAHAPRHEFSRRVITAKNNDLRRQLSALGFPLG